MTILQSTTSSSSPKSVRCTLDYERVMRTSLASSLKSLDDLTSEAETSTAASSYCDDSSYESSSTTSSSSTRRRVRFMPMVKVKDTISRHNMTDEEINNCFLQDEDYDEIRSHNKRIIRRFKSYHSLGDPLPSPLPKCCMDFEDDIETMENGMFLCTRGLERISSNSYHSYRQKSIDAVLEEQDYQDLEGYYDDDAIAELYVEINSPCKFRAVYLAMEDRIEAVGDRQSALEELETINSRNR